MTKAPAIVGEKSQMVRMGRGGNDQVEVIQMATGFLKRGLVHRASVLLLWIQYVVNGKQCQVLVKERLFFAVGF
jgi:hypothetical protein